MTQIRESHNRTLTTKKVWKVAIYLRLSQEDGKDESLSVSNQRKIIYEYLENEFNANYEIIDTYIDDGISGITTTHRPRVSTYDFRCRKWTSEYDYLQKFSSCFS